LIDQCISEHSVFHR